MATQIFKPVKVYKDKQPYDTIHMIRGILYDCGLFLNEKTYRHLETNVSACRIYLGDDVFAKCSIGTNGKGMNSRFALASAYGEFMERLECGMLIDEYIQKAYSNGDLKYKFAPDEKQIRFSEMSPDAVDMIMSFLKIDKATYSELFKGLDECTIKCIPFYDVENKKVTYVPYELTSIFATTNGMCAGNSPEEAITQGLAELFERNSLVKIYSENPEIPRLRPEMFEGSEVIKRLDKIKHYGCSYEILDLSMGLDYPVIGLNIRKGDYLLMDLGADTNPIIALERSLTESFQAIDPSAVANRFHDGSCGLLRDCTDEDSYLEYYRNYRDSLISASGKKPDNIYSRDFMYSDYFKYNDRDDVSSLQYMISLFKANGYHLYVRDCSWLGFPAYITFCPEITLADYNYNRVRKKFAHCLKYGAELSETPAYDEMLPLLKKLENKYESNVPNQMDLAAII